MKLSARSFVATNFRDILRAALLFAVLVAAYWPALKGGFLLDDAIHVTAPELSSFHGLRSIWFKIGAVPQYYPFLHTTFWFENRLWGKNVVGYHMANLLQHMVCAYLVVLIMRALALPGAWFGAFFFALHPVCTESVAWISEQKNTLSTMFYLGSALLYLHFDKRRTGALYYAAFSLFILALLSKTVSATLPAVLLVVFWWQRGRIRWKLDVLPLVPWLAIGAVMGLLSAWMECSINGAVGGGFSLAPGQRFLLAGRGFWFYLSTFLWPVHLLFIYPKWDLNTGISYNLAASFGVLAFTLVLSMIAWRWKIRGPFSAFLIYAGMLFPILGFLNIAYFQHSYVADHFQYSAILALIVPIAFVIGTATICSHGSVRTLLHILKFAIIAAFVFLTYSRNHVYSNAETLYRDTANRNPAAWVAHNNLGNILLSRTLDHSDHSPYTAADALIRLSEAMDHFSKALKTNPMSAEIHNNMGSALSRIPGRKSDAISHYEHALKLRPDYPEAHNNLANALRSTSNRLDEAISHYHLALRSNPQYVEALNGLAGALAAQPGHLPEAIEIYKGITETSPHRVESWNNYGVVLARVGRRNDAIAQYRAALELDPRYAEARFNLANALADSPDDTGEAIRQYMAVFEIDSNHAKAHCNLGSILANVPGRLPDAIKHLEHAVAIAPNLVEARFSLGSALSHLPARRNDAVNHLQETLRLAPSLQPAQKLLDQLRDRQP